MVEKTTDSKEIEENNEEECTVAEPRSKKKKVSLPEWHKQRSISSELVSDYTAKAVPEEVLSAESEVSLFKLFFDDSFMDFIVQQLNLYGQQQNKTLNLGNEGGIACGLRSFPSF